MSHLDSYVWKRSFSELSDDVAFFFLAAWLTYIKVHCWGDGWIRTLNMNWQELTGQKVESPGRKLNLKPFQGWKIQKTLDVLVVSVFFWRLLVSPVLRVWWGHKKLSRGKDGPPCLNYPFIVDSMMPLQDNLPSTNYYSSIASLELFQLGHHGFAIGSCLYYI